MRNKPMPSNFCSDAADTTRQGWTNSDKHKMPVNMRMVAEAVRDRVIAVNKAVGGESSNTAIGVP